MGSRDEGSSERGVCARLSQRLSGKKKGKSESARVGSEQERWHGRERQLSPGSEFAFAVGACGRKRGAVRQRRTCCVSILPPSPYCPAACVALGAAATSFNSAICGEKRAGQRERCSGSNGRKGNAALGAVRRRPCGFLSPLTLFLGAPRAFLESVPVIVSFACDLRLACLLRDAPPCGKKPSDPARARAFCWKAPGPRPLGFYDPPYEPRGGHRSLLGRVRELTRFTVRTRAARTDKHGRTACASKVSGPGIPRKEQKGFGALFASQKSRFSVSS